MNGDVIPSQIKTGTAVATQERLHTDPYQETETIARRKQENN